jgi:6-phosphogluconate dehydrogenase (decarboxylating)
MELGMIGLRRMGANMTERLLRGHRVISYDRSVEAIQQVIAALRSEFGGHAVKKD